MVPRRTGLPTPADPRSHPRLPRRCLPYRRRPHPDSSRPVHPRPPRCVRRGRTHHRVAGARLPALCVSDRCLCPAHRQPSRPHPPLSPPAGPRYPLAPGSACRCRTTPSCRRSRVARGWRCLSALPCYRRSRWSCPPRYRYRYRFPRFRCRLRRAAPPRRVRVGRRLWVSAPNCTVTPVPVGLSPSAAASGPPDAVRRSLYRCRHREVRGSRARPTADAGRPPASRRLPCPGRRTGLSGETPVRSDPWAVRRCCRRSDCRSPRTPAPPCPPPTPRVCREGPRLPVVAVGRRVRVSGGGPRPCPSRRAPQSTHSGVRRARWRSPPVPRSGPSRYRR
jgi:hypothetical protein